MSRKKKIILSGIACLAVVLIGVLIWGGNYLVTFAIGRIGRIARAGCFRCLKKCALIRC